ncbi:helix-turn-helix domain-containing protein [Streptomyces cavernicola]|uniref:Helix-turn-helix transcriptional regulator n=1 Tax=Streptomyces cavernicola TaxID=3043613 RepID=A0ABT6SKY1_9ACTN|nr:helix-turn-helix transcriptional regulator [Streptomyces sp. B-S-A6]MDI3408846.1 helix-turn-helix transcriptional regulator [Streptomyces sp. B-S-A6]
MSNVRELNPEASPQAAFGARLRKSREERGWRQDELAERTGYSDKHISATETGRRPPTLRFSRALDAAFGFTGTAESFERTWGEIRTGILLEGFPEYLGQEAHAAEVRLFEVGLIPGPLQTREYAQALADSAVKRGLITPDQADERVSLLMKRQAKLVRPQPPLVIAVLDESCVRRPVGGSAVMDAQLASLTEFAEQPHTMLQIVPYAVGEYRPLDRLVNLLTLQDRSVVSYVESETQGNLDRTLASVLPLVKAYHQLQAVSLSQTASVDMIHQLRGTDD